MREVYMSATKDARNRAVIEQARSLSEYLNTLQRERAGFDQAVSAAGTALSEAVEHRDFIVGVQDRTAHPVSDAQQRIIAARVDTCAAMVRLLTDTEEHAATVTASAIARHSTATGSVDARLLEGFRGDADALEHGIAAVLAEHSRVAADYEARLLAVVEEWVAFEEGSSGALFEHAKSLAAQRLHRAHIGSVELLRSVGTTTLAKANPAGAANLPGPQLPAPAIIPTESPASEPPAAPVSDPPTQRGRAGEAGDPGEPGEPGDEQAEEAPSASWNLLGRAALPIVGITVVLAFVLLLLG